MFNFIQKYGIIILIIVQVVSIKGDFNYSNDEYDSETNSITNLLRENYDSTANEFSYRRNSPKGLLELFYFVHFQDSPHLRSKELVHICTCMWQARSKSYKYKNAKCYSNPGK